MYITTNATGRPKGPSDPPHLAQLQQLITVTHQTVAGAVRLCAARANRPKERSDHMRNKRLLRGRWSFKKPL